jgi:hypothetical protein
MTSSCNGSLSLEDAPTAPLTHHGEAKASQEAFCQAFPAPGSITILRASKPAGRVRLDNTRLNEQLGGRLTRTWEWLQQAPYAAEQATLA